MEHLTKMIFMDFLTQKQYINIRGNHTIQTYTDHMISFLKDTESYDAFYEDSVLYITEKNTYTSVILRMNIDEIEKTFNIETGNDAGLDMENQEELKIVGNCAMFLINAHTEWETNVGLIEPDKTKYKEISLSISETYIMLQPHQQAVIYDLLEKIAKHYGFDYDQIENKNFELELRGLYPLDAPIKVQPQDQLATIELIAEGDFEEESSSIDDWLI
jgi:hypothetical protein